MRQPSAGALEVIVENQWSVVGKLLALVDAGGRDLVLQARRDDVIVDAPTDVLFIRRAAVAPPGVGLALGIRMQGAITVDPADVVENGVQPRALVRQEAGGLEVAFP